MSNMRLYLLCSHFNQDYAIPIGQIVEVVNRAKFTSLPKDRDDLLGLMNLRGDVVPIVNLSRTIQSDDIHKGQYVVICEIGDRKFGFPIEEARQVAELDARNFQSASGVVGAIDSNLVEYLSIQNDKTVLVLELERIIRQ